MDAAFWNAQVQANENAIRAGSLALTGQVAGSLIVATSATQLARVAPTEKGIPYFSGGVWTVQRLIDIVFPVGAIYRSVVSTNPVTVFGVGTWEAFGAGRMLVGVDTGDADFSTATLTGGVKTHALSIAEMPVHGNASSGVPHTIGDAGHSHLHGYDLGPSGPEFTTDELAAYPNSPNRTTQSVTTGVTMANAGSGTAHNNLQPYIVIYRFRRTA